MPLEEIQKREELYQKKRNNHNKRNNACRLWYDTRWSQTVESHSSCAHSQYCQTPPPSGQPESSQGFLGVCAHAGCAPRVGRGELQLGRKQKCCLGVDRQRNKRSVSPLLSWVPSAKLTFLLSRVLLQVLTWTTPSRSTLLACPTR